MHRGESPHSSPANSPSSQKSPQSATGFFGFCAVLQSFQEKTNSSSLTLQGTPLKLPHPITKVLGEGGMGFGEGREKPLLPPLWGFFRKVLPPFPKSSPPPPQFPFPTSSHPKARGTASPRRDREARKQDAPCGHGCRAGQATRRGCRRDSGTRPRPQEAS